MTYFLCPEKLFVFFCLHHGGGPRPPWPRSPDAARQNFKKAERGGSQGPLIQSLLALASLVRGCVPPPPRHVASMNYSAGVEP